MTWISVKDKLPKHAGYYLGWVYDELDMEDQCARYTCFMNVGKRWEIELVDTELVVTHWMELPKGPNEDKKTQVVPDTWKISTYKKD